MTPMEAACPGPPEAGPGDQRSWGSHVATTRQGLAVISGAKTPVLGWRAGLGGIRLDGSLSRNGSDWVLVLFPFQ